MEYLVRDLSKEQTAEIYRQWIHKHFPQDEIKPLKHILAMWDLGAYVAFGMYEQGAERLTGYAFFAAAPGSGMLLLDYFAIMEEYRSQGMGSYFLGEMKRLLQGHKDISDKDIPHKGILCKDILCKGILKGTLKGILIETEDVERAQNKEELETRQGRDLFYQRNGAVRTRVKSRIYGVDYAIWNLPLSGQPDSDECRKQLESVYRIMVSGDKYEKYVSIYVQPHAEEIGC